MTAALKDAVRELHRARTESTRLENQVSELQVAWEAEHAELIQQKNAALRAACEADRTVRALATAEHEATQETKPSPGVEVVLTSTMDYRVDDALAWAKDKQMALIPESLDTKAFAKIAKATPLPFVTYGKIASVRIASDLSKALEHPNPAPADKVTAGVEAPF